MTIKILPIDELEINRANDRHGELENETAAIAWLFNTHEVHMRNLAKDIAAEKQLYETPLVWPTNDGSSYVVFDGNRRVTCLKLIHYPDRAPNEELQTYFKELHKEVSSVLPKRIRCEVEADRDRIDAILYRRHTGSQNGVGQSKWTDRMKTTFVTRTGKGGRLNTADEIEKRLREANKVRSKKKIPRSTLNRLLSSEVFRTRLGFSTKSGEFVFTHDPKKSLDALSRVTNDLAERRIVLGDIWDVRGKTKYLNDLEKEGVLPTAHDAIEDLHPNDAEPKPTSSRPTPTRPPRPSIRRTLILQDDHGVAWTAEMQRIRSVWEELQFHLQLKEHPNAISVLLRVLIELAVRHYAGKHPSTSIFEKDKLANVIQKVAAHLESNGDIDANYLRALKALSNSDKIMSTAMMHQYVHSSSVHPSPEHLVSIWETTRRLVILALSK